MRKNRIDIQRFKYVGRIRQLLDQADGVDGHIGAYFLKDGVDARNVLNIDFLKGLCRVENVKFSVFFEVVAERGENLEFTRKYLDQLMPKHSAAADNENLH